MTGNHDTPNLSDNLDSLITNINLDQQSGDDDSEDSTSLNTAPRTRNTFTNVHGQQENYYSSGYRTRQTNVGVVNIQSEPSLNDIRRWLDASDPEINHTTLLRQHQEGTCTWLLEHKQYKQWLKSGHLWLHGKPGCGKSVLTAVVINALREKQHENLVIFYLTFSDTGKQTYDDLLRSLIDQLAARANILASLRQAYKRQLSAVAMEKLVLSIEDLILVVDGLDECSGHQRRELLEGLTRLARKVKIFVSSRELEDIRSIMQTIDAQELPVPSSQVDTDIEIWLSQQFINPGRLRDFKTESVALVKEKISEKSDGMFRWATLQLDGLKALQTTKRDQIIDILDKLPTTLDETYTRILAAIDKSTRKDALTFLYWLAYAQRPCSLTQLTDTIVIDVETMTVDLGNRGNYTDVLHTLTSLVTVVRKDDDEKSLREPQSHMKVQLAHFSVKEFLESDRTQKSEARSFHLDDRLGHQFLMKSCIAYLMAYSQRGSGMPLMHYSATSWFKHSLLGEDGTTEADFLLSDAAIDWERRYKPLRTWNPAAAMYFASYYGLERTVEHLLHRGTDPNPVGGEYGSAINVAVAKGRTSIIEKLLEYGAELTADLEFGTPLFLAAKEGQLDTMKLLLEAGANPEAGRAQLLPTHVAASNGHLACVELLLKAGANICRSSGEGVTPIWYAAKSGHWQIVQLLLQAGAPKNGLLYFAVRWGNLEMVRLLIDETVNVPSDFTVPLCAAAQYGDLDMVKLFLERGANVDLPNYAGETPFMLALCHTDVLEALIAAGADICALDQLGHSLLRLAYMGGHTDAIKVLCEASLNVDVVSKDGNTPLHMFSEFGQLEMVQLLVPRGIHNANVAGHTPLHLACDHGHADVVETLVNAGSDIHKVNSSGYTPLHLACRKGDPDIINILIKATSNIQSVYRTGQTPLHFACERNNADIVRLLIGAGSDNRAVNSSGCTPLHLACERNNADIVKLLVDAGSEIRAVNNSGCTPLHLACIFGHADIVEMLVDAGSSIRTQDKYGRLPSDIAFKNGHKEIARRFLKRITRSGEPYAGSYTIVDAAASEDVETVQLLLATGSDVDQTDLCYGTALQAAARTCHMQMVQLLCKTADVNKTGGLYNNAYVAAYLKGYSEVCLALKNCGAELTVKNDQQGRNILHLSAIAGSEIGFDLGLPMYDIDARDNAGWTALHWAAYFGSVSVVVLLMARGADTTLQDWRGRTPEQILQYDDGPSFMPELFGTRKHLFDTNQRRYSEERANYNTLGHPCSFCYHDIYILGYRCLRCQPALNLCIRCIRDADVMHPGHTFEPLDGSVL